MSSIALVDVRKSYPLDGFSEPRHVLAGVSLVIAEGDVCALLGPSGCGKSTLLRIIIGTETLDDGTVTLDPDPKTGEVGIVFQADNCLPWLRVRDNVQFGMDSLNLSESDRGNGVAEALRKVKLSDKSDRYPASMSGGEQQRVAFARLLASGKKIWLLDEPFSALDARNRLLMRELLRERAHNDEVTTLLVTHDLVEAVALADRIYVMSDVPSFISCSLDRVGELRDDNLLALESHRYLSEIIGAREPSLPEGRLAGYVTRHTMKMLP